MMNPHESDAWIEEAEHLAEEHWDYLLLVAPRPEIIRYPTDER